MPITRPVVFCFSGHDPSGGAGVQADIETLVSHRCHAASVVTALTEQDSRNVRKLLPQHPDDIVSQANTVLADLDVKVFKIGLIGHYRVAEAIHAILQAHPHIPVVLDPVLAAGGGAAMSDNPLLDAIVDLLLPRTTMLTPNSNEARKLAGLDDLDQCGLALLDKGCRYVLITGAHEATPTVSNRLYHDRHCIETYHWDRLPGSYHGSGCTLASGIAGLLAQGLTPVQAVAEAQEYTWNALQHGYLPGKGQHNPDRLFWMETGI
ncbi:MAG: bifunctional hydroxymethylpyrimidine kinase/phosphomethylpyrimidine kinase [Gammaproteobacteria bacterium]